MNIEYINKHKSSIIDGLPSLLYNDEADDCPSYFMIHDTTIFVGLETSSTETASIAEILVHIKENLGVTNKPLASYLDISISSLKNMMNPEYLAKMNKELDIKPYYQLWEISQKLRKVFQKPLNGILFNFSDNGKSISNLIKEDMYDYKKILIAAYNIKTKYFAADNNSKKETLISISK